MSAKLEEDAPRVGTPASQAAVEECYRAEHARLWRSLLLFSGDADLASDAVSEAFTPALHRGTAIRDLRRWVWRAAFAIARGELAARGRHAPELDNHPSVEMPADGAEALSTARRFLSALEDHDEEEAWSMLDTWFRARRSWTSASDFVETEDAEGWYDPSGVEPITDAISLDTVSSTQRDFVLARSGVDPTRCSAEAADALARATRYVQLNPIGGNATGLSS
jgi:DNA-directed RNA polymerase specialized sigma24 family protein